VKLVRQSPHPSTTDFPTLSVVEPATVRAPITNDSATLPSEALEALRTRIETGDLDAATTVLRDHWFPLVNSHEEDITRLLDTVPCDDLHGHPLLSMALGIRLYRVPYRRTRAFLLLICAIRSARRHHAIGLDPLAHALIRAAEGTAFRLLGRAQLGVRPSLDALRILDRLESARTDGDPTVIGICTQVGSTLYAAGRFAQAIDVFTRGAHLSLSSSTQGFGCWAMLAGIHASRGDLARAAEAIGRARGSQPSVPRGSGASQMFLHLAEALLALERLDPETAITVLRNADHDPAAVDHWRELASVQAYAELVSGRPGEALAALNAFVAARGEEGDARTSRMELASVRSLLELGLGSPGSARAILQQSRNDEARQWVQSARVELFSDDVSAVLQILAEAPPRGCSPRVQAEHYAVEAAALLRHDRSLRAIGVVRRLGALSRRSGLRTPLLLVPSADLRRLSDALTTEGYDDVVRDLPSSSILADYASPALTPREMSVLFQLAMKPSTKQIAAALYVSPNTVKSQLRTLYRKLGASTREEALAAARSRDILPQR